MDIPPVGADLFRADGRTDGRTDMKKLIVAFRNSANARKNKWLCQALAQVHLAGKANTQELLRSAFVAFTFLNFLEMGVGLIRRDRHVMWVLLLLLLLFYLKHTFKNVYFCRTVAIDMRGYGDSEKPSGVEHYAMDHLVSDVKQVVQALGSY